MKALPRLEIGAFPTWGKPYMSCSGPASNSKTELRRVEDWTERRSPRSTMGIMIFQLPAALADDAIRQELERSSVTGGQDNMPYPTDAVVEAEQLILSRCVQERGNMPVPWRGEGV